MATGGVFVHVDVIQESVHAVCSSSKPVKMGYITDLCRSVCVCVCVCMCLREREERERERVVTFVLVDNVHMSL